MPYTLWSGVDGDDYDDGGRFGLGSNCLSGRFRSFPSSEACAMVSGHVGQWRLAGGVGPVLVRRKQSVAEIMQQHLRAEGRTIQILLVVLK